LDRLDALAGEQFSVDAPPYERSAAEPLNPNQTSSGRFSAFPEAFVFDIAPIGEVFA
jgi:hypothetical protein